MRVSASPLGDGMPGGIHATVKCAAGEATSDYLDRMRGKMFLLFFLVAGLLILCLFAVTRGSYDLPATDVLKAFSGRLPSSESVVIWRIRMPRIVSALVVGWGLSISGLGIQSLLKNPLGSSSTLGISQGAAFGAAAAIVLFNAQSVSVTIFALAGATGATAVILILARLKRLGAEAVILAGVALSSLFASATILVQYLATETELAAVVFWTFGDVTRSNWSEIGVTALVSAAGTLFFALRRWDLNALLSGDETARGLGVDVERLRLMGMTTAALVAAVATSFHGVIAFVGLIAPHMARRLVGEDHFLLIVFSAVIGAGLLLAADTVARLLVGSGSLPVGVITAFMGAPMFLYLLARGSR
ncbi:MAG: FecCD family ABC transporter permease [Desulfobacterales bacterium]